MPYLPSDAEKKSNLYNSLINGDSIEYQSQIDDLINKQQVSSSIDANSPLRENGILVSFESAIDGVALEEKFQEVRLENAQYFFNGQLDNEFKYYFQPEDVDDGDEDDDTDTGGGATDEQVEFQMTNRDYLIQVMSEYFNEEYTPDMSTDLLHSKLNRYFKTEGPVGGKNAPGWEEYRQDKIKVEKFRKKGKKKPKIGGKGRPRANYRDLKRDLNCFCYDDVINKQLYHTRRGQEIWLKLDFPWVTG